MAQMFSSLMIEHNVLPFLQTLMIKRELAKDPALKNESWDRFLPKFKKKNVTQKKKKEKKEKKEYTPFPPPQQPSKLDLQLESGEYFITEAEKQKQKRKEKAKKKWEAKVKKQEERKKAFVPPKACMILSLCHRSSYLHSPPSNASASLSLNNKREKKIIWAQLTICDVRVCV